MIILFKLAMIVLITAVLISLNGMITLKFSGYEIYMKATTFGALVVLLVFVVWKLARIFDWAVYVPRNFLYNRKLQKQVDLISDVIVVCEGGDLSDKDKSLKKLSSSINNPSINKFLNASFENKNQRITTLKTIFDSGETDDKIKQIVAVELLKFDNKTIEQHILKNIAVNGVLPSWALVFQAINASDITTAKSTLHLAKNTGLSRLKYTLYDAYISAKFNEADAVEKIITAWKKIHNDKYLNSHFSILFKAVLMLEKITIKQFKSCEKAIHETKWQGAVLLSVLALKNNIYGLAKDYLALVYQMDGCDKFINLIKVQIILLNWQQTSDENKREALEKSIKYTVF